MRTGCHRGTIRNESFVSIGAKTTEHAMVNVRIPRSRVFMSVAIALLALGAPGCNAVRAQVPEYSGSISSKVVEKKTETAVLAGGCFWGVDAVFKHVKGVENVVSGYSGGSADTAQYELVSTGETGHAESVKILYDPEKITYGQILRVFFSVAHDPT